MKMNIHYLREFLIVAEMGSLARASEHLLLSPSALSKHMSALEEDLGVRLLHRTSRSITLSEFGEILLPYAQKILREQEYFLEHVHQAQPAPCRAIRIGEIDILKLYALSGLVHGFKLEHPEIELHLFEQEQGAKELLLKGRLDAAFVRDPAEMCTESDKVGVLRCVEDLLVAVLPAGHPLAGRGPIDLRQLREEPFFLLDRQHPASHLCINACMAAGFSPRISGSGFSGAESIECVGRGLGVTLMARRLFEEGFAHDERVVPTELIQHLRTCISLIWLKDGENRAVTELFLRYFRQRLHEREQRALQRE